MEAYVEQKIFVFQLGTKACDLSGIYYVEICFVNYI